MTSQAGRYLGFLNFQIWFKFSHLYLRLTGKQHLAVKIHEIGRIHFEVCLYLVSFLAKKLIIRGQHTDCANFFAMTSSLMTSLNFVSKDVFTNKETVMPKLLTIGQGAKNLKPRKIEGGGSVDFAPPPPQGF